MGTCVHFSRSLPSNSWWQTMVGWQVLSRPSAAEGGGRRPAFTGLATQPYSATEVDGWQHKLSRVSQNRAAVHLIANAPVHSTVLRLLGGPGSHEAQEAHEARKCFSEGKERSIALLRQAIFALEDEIADAQPMASVAPQPGAFQKAGEFGRPNPDRGAASKRRGAVSDDGGEGAISVDIVR